ncbi:MAG: tetratricopeptide repeat protein, partial [Vicinamibacteria bacterium]|nr:tetratricopeptide repeat protein [Vicinamibacteria bacterium]
TAQLIHARTDQHLWVEHYERDLKDVLALQGEVARAIAAEVRAQVTPQEQARLGSKRAVPPDAYEAYLKGRYHWNQARVANYQQAVEFFERALKVMPDYGPAQAGLAGSFLSLAANEMDRAQQARSFELARRAAQRAIDLDGNDAEALSILGRLRLYADWDFMGAAEAIERAVQRDPSNSSARTSHGLYLCLIGRYDEAIVAHRQALEIDPLSISLNHQLAWTYWHAQRLDEAIAQARQTLELNPNHASSRAYLALSFAMQKKRDAALAEQRLIAGYNSGHVALALGATIEAIAGQREVAQKLLAQARHAGWTDPEGIACVYALLGERERVFEWLERGYQERAPMMIWIRADPLLASVRTDPRFASLLERMRYPD